MVERFRPVGVNYTDIPSISTAGQEASSNLFRQVASTLRQVTNDANDVADRMVAEKKKQEGLIAGSQTDFSASGLMDGDSIAARSFNEGATQSYLAKLQIDQEREFTRMSAQYRDDPAALSDALNTYMKETQARMPSDVASEYIKMAVPTVKAYVLNATRSYEAERIKQTEEEKDAALISISESAVNNARIGNPENEAALAADIAKFGNMLQASGLPDFRKQQKLAEFQRAVRAGTVVGQADRMFRESGAQSVEALARDIYDGKGPLFSVSGPLKDIKNNPIERQELATSVYNTMRSNMALTNIERASVTNELKKHEELAQLGGPLSGLDAAIDRAIRIGATDIAQSAIEQRDALKSVREFAKLPTTDQITQMQVTLESIQTGKATPELATAYKAMADVMAIKTKAVKTDPLSYYERQGVLTATNPANPGAKDFPDVIAERRKNIAILQEREGESYGLLKPGEQNAFLAALKQADPQQRMALIGQVSGAMTPGEISKSFDNIGDKDPALVSAVIFGKDDPTISESIINGLDIIKNKAVVMPTDNAFNGLFNQLYGEIGLSPEVLMMLRESTRAAFADYLKRTDPTVADPATALNEDGVKNVFNRLFGEPVKTGTTFSKVKTLSFRKDDGTVVSPGDFGDLIKVATPIVLEQIQGDTPRAQDGSPWSVEMIRNSVFVPAGDGVYRLRRGSVNGAEAVGKDGKPFILDMRKVLQFHGDPELNRFKQELNTNLGRFIAPTLEDRNPL